jgi:hypothetical protein
VPSHRTNRGLTKDTAPDVTALQSERFAERAKRFVEHWATHREERATPCREDGLFAGLHALDEIVPGCGMTVAAKIETIVRALLGPALPVLEMRFAVPKRAR